LGDGSESGLEIGDAPNLEDLQRHVERRPGALRRLQLQSPNRRMP
jgi:hypothetical protein